MYKIELATTENQISDFNNSQLICSYFYLRKTFNYLYKRKLRNLNKQQKKAIIYDLSLFETIKKRNYKHRCLSPQSWLENWKVYNGITEEIKKRELSENYLDFS